MMPKLFDTFSLVAVAVVIALWASCVFMLPADAATYRDYAGPDCAWCGSRENLNVHHLTPQHLGGGDEPENLVTMCRRCHFVVAHAGNWKTYVPNMREIVRLRRATTAER